ncbi:hypothetical protein HK097_002751 [Rhizophlyctis rosea]|uniref:Uncharacterized protein n=1 Tax=Rhizophlyctis rosea TaxID=64517 RepID=A0AAD5SFC3_9FUNG|nr:hypothetical protein HK097_002751 [Rhizophlyctis rosea]
MSRIIRTSQLIHSRTFSTTLPRSFASPKSSKQEPSVNYSQEGIFGKDYHDAKLSSNEEDKQRQKTKRAGAVENAVKGGTTELRSKMARDGMDAKNQDDGMPAVKTDEEGISKSAPRPIIGLEDERRSFERPAGKNDFARSEAQKRATK